MIASGEGALLSKTKFAELKREIARSGQGEGSYLFLEGYKVCREVFLHAGSKASFFVSEQAIGRGKGVEFIGLARERGYPVVRLTAAQFAALSTLEHPEGFLCRLPAAFFPWVEPATFKIDGGWFFLDGVQDPGNLGTIIRTSRAFGLEGIMLGAGTVSPHNPKALRASSGSLFGVRYWKNAGLEVLHQVREQGADIWLLDPHAATFTDQLAPSRKMVFVLGSEGGGIGGEFPFPRIRIRHLPVSDSLNVAMSAVIMAHDYFRRHHAMGV